MTPGPDRVAGRAPSARFRVLAARGLLVLPAVAFLLFFLDLPLGVTLWWSLRDPDTGGLTAGNYADFVNSKTYVTIILRTAMLAGSVTVMTALIGYPLAYWMLRLSPRAQAVVFALIVMTFWVPILVRTYAWIVIFGNAGLVNRMLLWSGLTDSPMAFLYNVRGVAFGMVNVMLPLMVLPLFAGMRRIDSRLMTAAETLGATSGQVFRKVFLPLSLPPLAASSILVFILSLGFYITPAILGGGRVPMIANMMDLLVNRFARWEIASVNAIVLLVATLLVYGIYQWLRRS